MRNDLRAICYSNFSILITWKMTRANIVDFVIIVLWQCGLRTWRFWVLEIQFEVEFVVEHLIPASVNKMFPEDERRESFTLTLASFSRDRKLDFFPLHQSPRHTLEPFGMDKKIITRVACSSFPAKSFMLRRREGAWSSKYELAKIIKRQRWT